MGPTSLTSPMPGSSSMNSVFSYKNGGLKAYLREAGIIEFSTHEPSLPSPTAADLRASVAKSTATLVAMINAITASTPRLAMPAAHDNELEYGCMLSDMGEWCSCWDQQ